MNMTDYSVIINTKIVHLVSEVSEHIQTQHLFIPFHTRTILILFAYNLIYALVNVDKSEAR